MGKANEDLPTAPKCRCRGMHLGSAVPHIKQDGLQGIEEPLRDLYPEQCLINSVKSGIDSCLSVCLNISALLSSKCLSSTKMLPLLGLLLIINSIIIVRVSDYKLNIIFDFFQHKVTLNNDE